MRKRMKLGRPSHGTVVAYLALFVAIGGSAYAANQLPSNSVGTKQLKNNAVKGPKVANGSLTAADINGPVSSARSATEAAHAANADHAGKADTAGDATHAANADAAGNADKLDGQDASNFVDAAEIQSPGLRVMNDPNPGDSKGPSATMAEVGVFKAVALCRANLEGYGPDQAILSLQGPAGSSMSGNFGEVWYFSPSTTDAVFAAAYSTNNIGGSGAVTGVAPNTPTGQVVRVSGSAEVGDPAGDCVFGVTAIGP